jgi:hypothetical protein
MNGTNEVGMNGTNYVGVNGTDDFSTSQVGPELNGRRRRSMNGTNSVQLNGTNSVQLNGTEVYDLNPYDLNLNGVSGSADELDAIRLALAYGDEDIVEAYENGELNGLKEILAARKARLANETPEDRAARIAKRKALIGGVLSLASNAVPGGAAVGNKLSALLAKGVDKAKTLQTAVEKAALLEDAGVQPNTKALTTRAADEVDAGLEAPGKASAMEKIKQWWAGSNTVTKVAVIGGAAVAGYLVYRQFFAKKKKRR